MKAKQLAGASLQASTTNHLKTWTSVNHRFLWGDFEAYFVSFGELVWILTSASLMTNYVVDDCGNDGK